MARPTWVRATPRGVRSHTVELTEARQTFVFALDGEPAFVSIDPANRVLKTLSFEPGEAMLRAQLADDPALQSPTLAVVVRGHDLAPDRLGAGAIGDLGDLHGRYELDTGGEQPLAAGRHGGRRIRDMGAQLFFAGHDRHLGAHVIVEAGELNPDRARSDDEQLGRHLRRGHGVAIGPHPLAVGRGKGQVAGAGARGQHNVLGAVFGGLAIRRHRKLSLARQLGAAGDHGDLVLLHQELDALRVLLAHLAGALHRHAGRRRVDAGDCARAARTA